MSSVPVLPPELIWRIVPFVSRASDLRACSLMSRTFLGIAQQALFRAIELNSGQEQPNRLYSTLHSSPHLAGYITSLTLISSQSGLVELLPLLSQVCHLRLGGYDLHEWTRPVLEVLQQVTLPNITRLDLNNVSIPLSLIAACTQLACLSVLNSDIEDDDSLNDTPTIPLKAKYPLRVLSLDSIRNDSGQYSSLFRHIISSGRLPSLGCLRLPVDDYYRYKDDFSENELPDLLKPFQDTLTCLDVDYWLIPNPFNLGNFLNLTFLQISMGYRDNRLNPGQETVFRLTWLASMIQDLTNSHPLSILVLCDACEFWPLDEEAQEAAESLDSAQFQRAWTDLDDALNGCFGPGALQLKLPHLESVAIPLYDDDEIPNRHEAVSFFTEAFPRCTAAEKLEFREIDIEEYFWSLPKL
ncbi:hypothetical protein DL96DRAFT_1751533 [Flagelloscypha sp. PMI_526]|nr:hypothetical protein DL96DRAFT_1751533 [Flagelloscypha sp. PMI_526]